MIAENGTQCRRLKNRQLKFELMSPFTFSRHRGSARREAASLLVPHPRPPGVLGEPARQDSVGVVRHPADGVGRLLRAAGQVPRQLRRREQTGLSR